MNIISRLLIIQTGSRHHLVALLNGTSSSSSAISRTKKLAVTILYTGMESLYLRKDIDMPEKIQRRAIKLIPGLRDLRYEELLKECGLTTLETRRLRGIKLKCRILNGYENIDSNIFSKLRKEE